MRLRRVRNTRTHGSEPEPKQVEHGNKVIANGLAWLPREVVDFKAGQNCDEGQIQHAYRDVPTKARNIVAGMVAHKLRSQSRTATNRLGEDLNLVIDDTWSG